MEREKRIQHEPPIRYWNELRSDLSRRHMLLYNERELMDKLQRIQPKKYEYCGV